jgi:hypothetical protein
MSLGTILLVVLILMLIAPGKAWGRGMMCPSTGSESIRNLPEGPGR